MITYFLVFFFFLYSSSTTIILLYIFSTILCMASTRCDRSGSCNTSRTISSSSGRVLNSRRLRGARSKASSAKVAGGNAEIYHEQAMLKSWKKSYIHHLGLRQVSGRILFTLTYMLSDGIVNCCDHGICTISEIIL